MRRCCGTRGDESSDSETRGSGSGAGTAPEPNVGSATGRSDDPSALPMDVDSLPGAIGGTALVPQAPTGVDSVAATSAVPPRTRGSNWQPPQRDFPPRQCDLCSLERVFGTRSSFSTHLKVAHGQYLSRKGYYVPMSRAGSHPQRARVQQAASLPLATPAFSGPVAPHPVFPVVPRVSPPHTFAKAVRTGPIPLMSLPAPLMSLPAPFMSLPAPLMSLPAPLMSLPAPLMSLRLTDIGVVPPPHVRE